MEITINAINQRMHTLSSHTEQPTLLMNTLNPMMDTIGMLTTYTNRPHMFMSTLNPHNQHIIHPSLNLILAHINHIHHVQGTSRNQLDIKKILIILKSTMTRFIILLNQLLPVTIISSTLHFIALMRILKTLIAMPMTLMMIPMTIKNHMTINMTMLYLIATATTIMITTIRTIMTMTNMDQVYTNNSDNNKYMAMYTSTDMMTMDTITTMVIYTTTNISQTATLMNMDLHMRHKMIQPTTIIIDQIKNL